MSSVDRAYFDAFSRALMPPPELSMPDWADQEVQLSAEEAQAHGQFRMSLTPFAREILEKLSPQDPCQEVAILKGSQIFGTTLIKVVILYYARHAPTSILLYLPTNEDARDTVITKIMPSLEMLPGITVRLDEGRSRHQRSSTLNLKFAGGTLRTRGAKSSRAFRRVSAQIVIFDDYDGCDPEVSEGYIGDLARNRTDAYGDDHKIVFVTTPTLKGASSGEREYLKYDQRKYFVPCPQCGEFDIIRWSAIKYDEANPANTAVLCCLKNGCVIEEHHKPEMLLRGEWRPTREGPSPPFKHSYHLPALYSRWKSWGQCAEQWVAAHRDPGALKVFVNTVLAETYEVRGSGAEPDTLMARLEDWPRGVVPTGVGALTAFVDVQADRLELHVWGWGAAEECWLIEHDVIEGDPVRDSAPWLELDRKLRQPFKHENGRHMFLKMVGIDTGGPATSEGHASDQVYRFCATRWRMGVRALKGDRTQGRPIVGPPTRKNAFRVPLYLVCVDSSKELFYRRLGIGTGGDASERPGGPGYIHLPKWITREYAEQLASEKGVWVRGRTGVLKREWLKQRSRNEALDGAVGAHAALRIWGFMNIRTLPELARRFAEPAPETPPAEPAPKPGSVRPGLPTPRLPRRGWVNRWKR